MDTLGTPKEARWLVLWLHIVTVAVAVVVAAVVLEP